MISAKNRFASAYESHVDSLFRYCAWKTSDRETAKDIVQECFARFWDSLMKDKEVTSDRALLFTIARRLVIDHYRKKKAVSLEREGEYEEIEPADPSSLEPEAGAAGRYALEAIDRLDPAARQIVYLRFVEDVSPKEIAEILGISPNAASVRIDRALKKLKDMLDPR